MSYCRVILLDITTQLILMTGKAPMTQHSSVTRPLKILFISDVYFPRINGVSTSIRTFVEQLQGLGHTVHLIAPDYATLTEDDAWIMRVAARSIYFDPEDKLMKFGSAMALLPYLAKQGYDMIHVHTPFVAHYLGLKLSEKLGIPCVETYHTFF